MANLVAQKTIRKGTKSRVYVIEKIGDAYCVGIYQYGGLSAGWKLFKRLSDARRYFARLIGKAKIDKTFPSEVK
jgi:hypothetical protein